MKLTNRYGAPEAFVNAVRRDPYSAGASNISITGLLAPPRIALLKNRYYDELEEDVSDKVWALMGQAVHHVLERGAHKDMIAEERLNAEEMGWVISGQIDSQEIDPVDEMAEISDYKTVSVWATMNEKPDWEAQLNLYAWLLRKAKGIRTKKLKIIAIIRDWSRREAEQRADQGYPPSPIHPIEVKLWPDFMQDQFVKDRIKLHQEARDAADLEGRLPNCTDVERWKRPAKYAVMKKGLKRAIKVFDDAREAGTYAQGMGTAYTVVERHGEPIRCTGNYCQVAGKCEQFIKEQAFASFGISKEDNE